MTEARSATIPRQETEDGAKASTPGVATSTTATLSFGPPSHPLTEKERRLTSGTLCQRIGALCSIVSLSWLNPLVRTALRKGREGLRDEDVFRTLESDSCHGLYERLAEEWEREKETANDAKSWVNRPSIALALYRAFGRKWVIGGVYQFLFMCVQFALPLIIQLLFRELQWTSDEGVVAQEGWNFNPMALVYAVLLAVVSILSSIFMARGFYLCTRAGIEVRAALMLAVYRHALTLPSFQPKKDKQSATAGETLTRMSVDPERVFMCLQFLHFYWHFALTAVVTLIVLWLYIGMASIIGISLFVLILPIQLAVSRRIARMRRTSMQHTDKRMRHFNQILQNIRFVKLFAWEYALGSKVQACRNEELSAIEHSLVWRALLREMMFVAPLLCAFGIFVPKVYLLDEPLESSEILVTLAFLNILRFPGMLLSQAMATDQEAKISLQRLRDFLLLPSWRSHVQRLSTNGPPKAPALHIENAIFRWPSSNFTLRLDNVKINRGELVALVGKVGGGKTTFLKAMMGEVPQTAGRVVLRGPSPSFVSQEPWIQNLSLQNNVLFRSLNDTGIMYEAPETYEQVLSCAGLLPDLGILPEADQTEIGEQGINLSGGQKVRVTFARALQHEADRRDGFVLLDDPFASVDLQTCSVMFWQGVMGLLKDTTRIVCLNSHMYLLPYFDRVIHLQDGRVISSTVDLKGPSFREDETITPTATTVLALPSSSEPYETVAELVDDVYRGHVKAKAALDKQAEKAKKATMGDKTPIPIPESIVKHQPPAKRQLVQREMPGGMNTPRTSGGSPAGGSALVGGRTYARYGAAAAQSNNMCIGATLLVLLLTLYAGGQFLRLFAEYFLVNFWGSEEPEAQEGSRNGPLFCALIIATCLFLVIRSFFLVWLANRSSAYLHRTALVRVLKASVPYFFDTTLQGSILNRFGKDLDSIDLMLPEFSIQFLQNVFHIIGILILCLVSTPYFLVLAFILFIFFISIYRMFRRLSPQLKRFDSMSRSPVYALFGEVLHPNGLCIIRTFEKLQLFIDEGQDRIDANTRYFSLFWLTSQWILFRMELTAALITSGITLLLALFTNSDTMQTDFAGLAIVSSLQLTALFQRTIKVSLDVENYMTCTERLLEYSDIPQEAAYFPHWSPSADLALLRDPSKRPPSMRRVHPPPSVPSDGHKVVFDDVWLKYRQGHWILKGVSFGVRRGERIGVVGRTGAGKSSIINALFRMNEVNSGTIRLDGEDTQNIPLHTLRNRLAIIPQDPTLFGGTLHDNLDPSGKAFPEADIQAVFNLLHLKDLIQKLGGLDGMVAEQGSNLSAGQRQLVCVARALLRSSEVLVLDEATAQIDSQTDQLIQAALRDATKTGWGARRVREVSVITIAHRLETVMDYDRILVLDKGKVAEFDTPERLKAAGGIFSEMVRGLHELDEAAAEHRSPQGVGVPGMR